MVNFSPKTQTTNTLTYLLSALYFLFLSENTESKLKKSKLLDICQSLTDSEWKSFLLFLDSPYFNSNGALTDLAKHLRLLAKKGWPETALDRKALWNALYRETPYSYKDLAYQMSGLAQLAEQFIGLEQQKEHTYHSDLLVLESLAKRKLEKSFSYRLQRMKSAMDKDERQDGAQLYSSYWLAQIEDDYFNLQNTRAINPFIQVQDQHLNDYFVLSKLRLFCTMLNQKRVLGAQPSFSWPTAAPEDYPSDNPVIQIYQCLYRLLLEDQRNAERFAHYQQLLQEVKSAVPPMESINLYYFAINYCLGAINQGQQQYAEQLLSIYQSGLEAGNLLINNELSPWIYKNIIKLGLGLKRFEWVESIIRTYTDKLPLNDRQDAFYFNLADLYYYQQKYDLAQEHLNKVEFSDVFYKHGARIMLLKIFFEKDETEAFLSLAHSYKLLLLRERNLAEDLKASYRNFVRLTSKLYKTKDKIKLEGIRTEVMRTKRINARRWLISQLEERLDR